MTKQFSNTLFTLITLLIMSSSVITFSQNSSIDYDKLNQRYKITQEKDGILKLQDKLTGKTIDKDRKH